MTILFESPNVFYAVIDGVNIRIDNPEVLPQHDLIGKGRLVQPGDIFQVEGFEYEVKEKCFCGTFRNCKCALVAVECDALFKEVAILKLAKEEEPKEKIYTIDEVIHKLRLGLSEYGKKSGIAGYWVLEDNVYYILNKLKK